MIKLAPHVGVKTSINKESWPSIFKSLKNVCKETRRKEFQFKLIHRIVITKRNYSRFGIKTDDECLYCGNKDSIEHTFTDCPFTESFTKKVIQWFNEANCCQISPTTKELLFGLIPSSKETKLRGGPLEIPGGGAKNFQCTNVFFFSQSWLQEFFFHVEGLHEFFSIVLNYVM